MATCSGLITFGGEAGIGVPSINDTLANDSYFSGSISSYFCVSTNSTCLIKQAVSSD